MSTLQSLALRRNAALGKLRSLQLRAERLSSPESSLVTTALAELESSLEEMLVATEHIQRQLDELAGARREADVSHRRFAEFEEILPLPCLWTTPEGDIAEANPAAADLLNVSRQRLNGRPLLLFLSDRPAFAQALSALNQGISRMVVIDILLRPRERRPRSVRLTGRCLTSDERHCWFITDAGDGAEAPLVAMTSRAMPRRPTP